MPRAKGYLELRIISILRIHFLVVIYIERRLFQCPRIFLLFCEHRYPVCSQPLPRPVRPGPCLVSTRPSTPPSRSSSQLRGVNMYAVMRFCYLIQSSSGNGCRCWTRLTDKGQNTCQDPMTESKMTQNSKNIQHRGFAGRHRPNY
jgi:hypothetical protein